MDRDLDRRAYVGSDLDGGGANLRCRIIWAASKVPQMLAMKSSQEAYLSGASVCKASVAAPMKMAIMQARIKLLRGRARADQAWNHRAQVTPNATICNAENTTSRASVCGPLGNPRSMTGLASGCMSKTVIQIDQATANAQRTTLNRSNSWTFNRDAP